MNQMYSEFSHTLKANPAQISTLLTEYRSGYRAMSPKPYFIDITCDTDQHTGAFVSVKMKVAGVLYEFEERAVNTVPARIIVEFDSQMDQVIAIVVEATANPYESDVTISIFTSNNPYLSTFLDGLFVSPKVRQIYNGFCKVI